MIRMCLPVTLVGVSLLFAGCAKKNAAKAADEPAATPVEVATAKRGPISSVVSAEAILYPLKQATIVPKISAPVQRFLVQRGDHVRQGQLLAVLEDRDLVAAAQESKQLYEQAEASYRNTSAATMPDDLTKANSDVQAAQEGLDAAQKVYDSRVKLYQEGALAQKLVEDAKVAQVQARSQLETARQHLKSLQTVGQSAQLQGAQAQVDAAKAHWASSAAQVAYAEVRSPINGVVSDRPLNVGEMASAGSAVFSVVDISRVVARANVPVSAASKIRVNQPAEIAGGDTKLQGKVTVVSPTVDPNTTTIQIWVEAANPGEQLKLGTTAHISVSTGEIEDAVLVPPAALLPSDEGGEKVMVAGSDSLAHEQKVEVGIRTAEAAQITNGLKGGEQVIVSGALGLDDKAKIEVSKPAAQGDAKDEGK
jgi:multidrug efflux pump subunit AcrA (membrane-fusion protein)